jgi:tetratricopeptide (TPR) repeat protein
MTKRNTIIKQVVTGWFNFFTGTGDINIYNIYLLPKDFWNYLKENRAFALVFISLQISIFVLFLQVKDLYRISWGLWALAAFLFTPLFWGWHNWKRSERSIIERQITIIFTVSFIALFSWQSWEVFFPTQFKKNVFGIAVADLGYNLPWRAFDNTYHLSNYIYEHLTQESSSQDHSQSGGNIEFRRIGYLTDSPEAESYGKLINADMVIWGRVIKSHGGGTVIYFKVLETPDWSNKPEFPLILPVTNTSTDIFSEELDPESDLVKLRDSVGNETAIISSFIRGYAAYLNRDFPLAINHFLAANQAIEKEPELIVSEESLSLLYLHLGKANSHLGRLDEGMFWYKKAEDANNEEPAIPLSMALIYGSWGDEKKRDEELDKAQILIDKWIGNNPLETNPSQFNAAIYNRGIIHQINKEYKSAIIDFEQVIKNDPNFYIAYLNLSQALREYGSYEKAEKALNTAIEIAQQSGANASWAYVNLAWLYLQMEDKESAKASFQEAIKIDPDEMLIYYYYGDFLNEEGEFDAALDSYQNLVSRAKDKGQDIGWAYGILADFLLRQKMYQNAVENYELAIYYQPDDELLRTHLAEAYQAIGEDEKANIAYEKAITLNKGNYYVYASYGGFLFSVGSYEKAIEIYEESLSLRSKDGVVLFNLGRAYEANNMIENAKKTYERILNMQDVFDNEIIENTNERMRILDEAPGR